MRGWLELPAHNRVVTSSSLVWPTIKIKRPIWAKAKVGLFILIDVKEDLKGWAHFRRMREHSDEGGKTGCFDERNHSAGNFWAWGEENGGQVLFDPPFLNINATVRWPASVFEKAKNIERKAG